MSEMTSTPADLPVLATVACPYCGVVVPDARFCGACGAHLVHRGWRAPQRLHAYAAFPDEPVFRLSVVTSLFPHLSHRAKAPFRIAFAVFVLLLLIFALAGASAPLIAVSALSVPSLFLVYIWEVDPYEGSFIPPTLLCLLLGAGLGAGWAIVGGSYVDKALVPSLTPSLTSHSVLVAAILVPAIGQLLACVPMVVVRAFQRGPIESLDGFVAGATGALGFTLAATIDLMSPWLSNGQLTHAAFLANITQVTLRGVTLPLVTALATGFIGMAFWTKSGARATSARGEWLTSPGWALALALVVQVGLGFTDIAARSDAVLIGVHVVALGVLTIAMRVGLHYVLLHEALDVTIGAPRVCANCSHLVPAMAFCPQCGVADRAVARPHRRGATWPLINGVTTPPGEGGAGAEGTAGTADPDEPPPANRWPTAPPGAPGLKVGFPGAHELASPTPRVSHRAKALLLVSALGLLTVTLIVVALLATPGPAPSCSPLTCQGPPIGHPGQQQSAAGSSGTSGTLYKSSKGFTLRYPSQPQVQTDSGGIDLTYGYVHGGTSTLEVAGGPAGGATAETAVEGVAASEFPDTRPTYELPDPWVGYQPAYGAAYSVQPASADGSTQTDQVVVVAAVRNGFAIIVLEEGALLPTVTSSSPFFNGHPSPARVNMAYGFGDFIVNRIRFPTR
jgi:RNA polymerase subunit RPABC4/transcription elongation factor Spt4